MFRFINSYVHVYILFVITVLCASTCNFFNMPVIIWIQVWTNGRLHAATHRVVMSGDKNRFSIGFFSVPKWGKILKAPEEMVDDEHPILFKPFDFGEFMKFFSRKENVNDKFGLEKYCGVSY